jgi:methyl-accepting chemotaxis protein
LDGSLMSADTRPDGRRPRRRYWINPPLQLRYIGALVGVEALALAAVAWVLFATVWQPFIGGLDQTGAGAPAPGTLGASVRQVTVTTLALLVLFGVVCAAIGLVISHGVAGPLVQVKRAMHTAVEEDRFDHRVRLRRGDSLHDVADEVNLLLGHLEVRQREQRELLDRVAAAITSVSRALQSRGAVAEDVLEQTQELEGLVHRARR